MRTPRGNNEQTWRTSTISSVCSTRWSPSTPAATARIDELRGRIEILMDEIEINLGIEPPPIFTPEDLDTDTATPLPARWLGAG